MVADSRAKVFEPGVRGPEVAQRLSQRVPVAELAGQALGFASQREGGARVVMQPVSD